MFNQMIMDYYLNTSNVGTYNRIKKRLLIECKKKISSIGKGTVHYKIGKVEIELPFSHDFPWIASLYPQHSMNLGRIAYYLSEKCDNLKVIDVGGNVGDSIAIIKHYVDIPILTIEGNPDFCEYLRKNSAQFDDIYIENVFLGDFDHEIKGQIHQGNGTAHIEVDNANKVIKTEKLGTVIGRNESFKLAKLLKIDTDGFDCIIIRGSIDVIATAKPVIFFEYAPRFLEMQSDDGVSVFRDLRDVGYKMALFYSSVGEYMFHANINDTLFIEALHNYLKQTNGYCDICLFHESDMMLFEDVRDKEMQFASRTNRP